MTSAFSAIDTSLWTTVALWSFLPSIASSVLQSVYYRIRYPAGAPKPGDERFKNDRRNCYAIVVLLYLAYTFFESVTTVTSKPNYYQILGVERPHMSGPTYLLHPLSKAGLSDSLLDDGFNSKDLRTNFRKLSAIYHPDKTTDTDPDRAEATYRAIQTAYETLSNPTSRRAYDRVGPDASLCTVCKTDQDFVWGVGFPHFWGHHVTHSLFLVAMTLIVPRDGSATNPTTGNRARYWRVLVYVAGIVVEARILFGPGRLPLAVGYVPGVKSLTAWQVAQIARNLATTLFVASNHVLSTLLRFQFAGDTQVLLATLEHYSKSVNDEAGRQFREGFAPISREQNRDKREELMKLVKRRMERVALDARVSELSPEVREIASKVRARIVGGVRKAANAGGGGDGGSKKTK